MTSPTTQETLSHLARFNLDIINTALNTLLDVIDGQKPNIPEMRPDSAYRHDVRALLLTVQKELKEKSMLDL